MSELGWVSYSGNVYDENEYNAALETLNKGWVAFGEKCRQFEREFAPHLGKKFGVFVNSGSSANLLMIAALMSKNVGKLVKGDKVITPVAGFPTTVNPLLQLGLKPVFVDVTLPSHNLDLDKVEELLYDWNEVIEEIDVDSRTISYIPNPRPKALLFAHAAGNPPDMDRVLRICEDYNLLLLEDCCDGLGSYWDGKPLGSFGEMSTCSFYAAHHMCTFGAGGFVATDDSNLFRTLSSLRDWGRDCYCSMLKPGCVVDGTACGNRFRDWLGTGEYDHRYVYREIGYNLQPIEIQGAVGLEQIKKLPMLDAARRSNYEKLKNIFSRYEQFEIATALDKADPCWFCFLVTVKDGLRNELVRHFESNKIQTRPYFGGNLLHHPAYNHLGDPLDYPNADAVTKNSFFVGTYAGIDDEAIVRIKGSLERFINAKC